MRSHITANSYNIHVVKDFMYLGTTINTNHDVSLEIKRRKSIANSCYFGLNRQLSSATKLTLYNTHPTPASLWRGGKDAVKHRCRCLGAKCYARFLVQLELAMTSVSEPTGSCMTSSLTWTLLSGSAGSAMSFGWMKTLRRDECLMRWSAFICRGKDRVRVGMTRLKRL